MQTNLHAVSYYFTASWENPSGELALGGEYVGRSVLEVVNLFGCVYAGGRVTEGVNFFYFPPTRQPVSAAAIVVISLRFAAGGNGSGSGRPGTSCERCHMV